MKSSSLIQAIALLCVAAGAISAESPNHPSAQAAASVAAPPVAASWPSFRGPSASGVADGQNLPDKWSAADGRNILWRTAISGLGHSSPIVWGDRLFLTTASSEGAEPEFKPGLYGDGSSSDDHQQQHRWELLAINRHSGAIEWRRTTHRGKPHTARHPKASHATPTPATNGHLVVAYFGSEGVHAYTVEGHHLWSRDLGVIDAGAYNTAVYQWGVASSPILWRDLVILQCDGQGEDFLIALDQATGLTRWRTARDEWPSWSTPTVIDNGTALELVTNAPKCISGYDPANGHELWRLRPSSDITTPTPIFADGLIVVTSGRRPVKPLHVLRPGGRGDLTTGEGEALTSHQQVAWSKLRAGSYIPTPLAYRGLLYMLNNDGTLAAFRLATGEEFYRQRIPHGGGGFSGSPVAADGKLYLTSEDGDIFVLRAGESFELIAQNSLDEVLMATPALAGGTMYVRGRRHLFAITATAPPSAESNSKTNKGSS